MKTINKTVILLSVAISLLMWNCTEADKEFVHDSNIIDKLICKATKDGTEFTGVITEYDKNGDIVTYEFEQKDIEGGYGSVIFEIPDVYTNELDLENVYIVASVSWDQSITPSLSGRHDITGDGIVITVKSGKGTKRNYRIRGYYE